MSAMSAIANDFGSTFDKGGFNAQIYVSEQLTRQMVNTTQDVAIRCIQALAEKYKFDAEEAIQMLGLNMIKLERKAPVKAKVAKAAKVSAPKTAFPLPYNGEFNEACCFALRQNNGLYTQCSGIRKGDASYCKGCAKQMQKTGAEMPEYGTIQQRQAVGIFEYVDPKGRKPVAYAKIMKKYKIDQEQVLAEAGKFNIVVNPEHFVVPEESGKRGRPSKGEKVVKEKGVKGRPKKSKKVLQIEGDDEDLFASLVAEANQSEDDDVIMPKKGKAVKSDAEKEAERLAKEAEKAAKKEADRLAKEAKKKAEEEEKQAKKLAAEAAKKEKEAKIAAEKEAKRLAAEALAEQKKAEKEAKLAAEKAAKESKKSKKPEADAEADDEPDVVKKIEFEGKKYLKSKKTGIVYDYEKYVKEGEQVVIGKWNDDDNKIVFDDAEESEEEYDM